MISLQQHTKVLMSSLEPCAPKRFGVLSKIVGLTLEARGLQAPVGSICEISGQSGKSIFAEVIGFDTDRLLLMPISGASGLKAGARVFLASQSDSARVSESLLGRVVDALGHPLDDGAAIEGGQIKELDGNPLNPLEREPIRKVLDVGIKAINSLLTLGCGQRIGLVAGSGVGKSVLLGMLTKFTSADVVVIGLIGERGREVKDFIENILGEEGLRKAIVVAAPADESPLLRLRATRLAHLYAEFFRESGKDVLLLVDSLTRAAHAQREIGLAVGEPPTTKGYPPSVFSFLPRLIERSGTGRANEGTITAIYTLLAEGDDLNDPVVDIARASLDGQVILSRALADAAHYPAIDLNGSISRLMPNLCDETLVNTANNFRRLWTIYQQNEDLINVGAYERGSNIELDQAIDLREEMQSFLRQGMLESVDKQTSFDQMSSCLNNA